MQKRRMLLVVGLVLLVASAVGLEQEKLDQSGTKATVVLKDGTTLELFDFALFSSHIQPVAYYPSPSSSEEQELAVKVNQLWRVIPPATIRSLERQPDHKPGEGWWVTFTMTLTSGEPFTAQLPRWCNCTWLSKCEAFEFAGKTTVLGAEAQFAIDVRDLQHMNLETAGRWLVVDTTGKSNILTDLTYRSFTGPPDDYVEEFSFNGQPFDVVVGRATVALKLEQIESVVFSAGPQLAFHIRMRSGDEADGQPPPTKNRIARGFGRTADGSIWFDDLSLVKSITFGPLAARS